ncbi:unnamed protein product [Blepharisma stoltei]|uniref:Uncharacterized protein n=1 Tax=Blepharisma stoltei TaxID=1481888 RepID=A0AAU9JQG9_9CILI|nr:unnamed protein product [Blepharisma stoltei]
MLQWVIILILVFSYMCLWLSFLLYQAILLIIYSALQLGLPYAFDLVLILRVQACAVQEKQLNMFRNVDFARVADRLHTFTENFDFIFTSLLPAFHD